MSSYVDENGFGHHRSTDAQSAVPSSRRPQPSGSRPGRPCPPQPRQSTPRHSAPRQSPSGRTPSRPSRPPLSRSFPPLSSVLRRVVRTCLRRAVAALRGRLKPLRRLRVDAGMTTAEYAIGTVAACGFAALLYRVVTSGVVSAALSGLVKRALNAV